MEQKERALLIGVNIKNQPHFEEGMKELKELAEACQIEVVGQVEQNLNVATKSYYIGSGKVEEVRLLAEEVEADILIFDNELSPSQLRNLENKLDMSILDRTVLILEIFARRAKTREAKLQVEVSQLQYLLPRLVGANKELGRQGGASGARNRGLGEMKIELDRRRIEKKISDLNNELLEISNERQIRRARRVKSGLPLVALVGYTNAGKSTIMNALVEYFNKSEDKKVFEEDMLFATLDTSVRNITLPDKKAFLLSDTVGFINKLPHNLIKAFRSTLEEVVEADLLLHVIDISDNNYEQQANVTDKTLKQIGAAHISLIRVYNKADKISMDIPKVGPDSVFISAKEKIGLDELVELISQEVFKHYVACTMLIPYNQGEVVSYFSEYANVKSVTYEKDGTLLSLECKESDYTRYNHFKVD